MTVSGNSAEPPPVLRVARDTMTLLFFAAPIQKKTLTFDESRIRILDAGERSIIIQPVADLEEGERQDLGVFFADGRAPTRAAFVLVTDPVEVDSRIDVRRPEPPSTPCPTSTQPPMPRPEDFVLLGYVDGKGITTSTIDSRTDAAQGLSSSHTVAYRGRGWILVDTKIWNYPGRPAWTPRKAALAGRVGMSLQVRLVPVEKNTISPGDIARFLVVAEVQEPDTGQVFTLEVQGDGERHLMIPDVRFPKPGSGGSP